MVAASDGGFSGHFRGFRVPLKGSIRVLQGICMEVEGLGVQGFRVSSSGFFYCGRFGRFVGFLQV